MINVYHMQRLRPLSNCPNSWPTKCVATFTFTDWPYVWNRPPFFHNDAADGEEDSSASAQVRQALKSWVRIPPLSQLTDKTQNSKQVVKGPNFSGCEPFWASYIKLRLLTRRVVRRVRLGPSFALYSSLIITSLSSIKLRYGAFYGNPFFWPRPSGSSPFQLQTSIAKIK